MNNNVKNKKKILDKTVKSILLGAAILSAIFIILIVIIVATKGLRPFFADYGDQIENLNFFEFITGNRHFKPTYRIGYIIINTLYVVILAIIVTSPIAILTSLFIVKIAPSPISKVLTTIVEVLSAIPSIIYGVFGSGFVVILVRNLAGTFGIVTAGGLSTLSTVIVVSMMILPTITMLSVTAIKSVAPDIEHGSLALGASPTQTMFRISLNAAKPGIFAGIILGVGRALGEATAVSMVSGGNGSGPTFSLFDTTMTLTSTILGGFKELPSDSIDYDVRFSIGLILIVVILVINFLLNAVKKRMGKYYEQA